MRRILLRKLCSAFFSTRLAAFILAGGQRRGWIWCVCLFLAGECSSDLSFKPLNLFDVPETAPCPHPARCAGYETTSLALGYALFELAKQPELQARVAAEVAALGLVPGEELTYSHLQRLPLTLASFNEAMRLYPPVSSLAVMVGGGPELDVLCCNFLQQRLCMVSTFFGAAVSSFALGHYHAPRAAQEANQLAPCREECGSACRPHTCTMLAGGCSLPSPSLPHPRLADARSTRARQLGRLRGAGGDAGGAQRLESTPRRPPVPGAGGFQVRGMCFCRVGYRLAAYLLCVYGR